MSLLFTLSSALASPHVAVVVIDESAREEGFAIQIDDWLVEDALPVEVADGEKVQLVDADGVREPLDFEPGEVWEVSGAKGEAWMSVLEEEVRTDLIRVKGSPDTVARLAKGLGAEVIRDGEVVYLSGANILFEARWVDEEIVLEVREVGLVKVGEEPRRDKEGGSLPAAVVRGEVAAVAEIRAGEQPTTGQPGAMKGGTEDELVKPRQRTLEPVAERVFEPLEALPLVGDDAMPRYAGHRLCGNTVLSLHPAGLYAVGQTSGTWSVTSPGVVRLYDDQGEVWGRAAIDPETRHCRGVWSVGDAPGREVVKTKRREATERLGGLFARGAAF